MLYPDNLETLLDFDKVKHQLLKLALCAEGKLHIEKQDYFLEVKPLELELTVVSEMRKVIEAGESFSTLSFVAFQDILDTLKFEGSALTVEQLYRLHHIIKGMFELLKFFKKKERQAEYPIIVDLLSEVIVDKKWYQQIEKILDLDKVEIKSNASEALVKIRSKISKLERSSEKAFVVALKKYAEKGFLADSKESWRANRRVLAVLSEHKRQVPGLVLDVSGNARITFIEPASILPIAAEISECKVQEQKEIDRILRAITAEFYPYQSNFEHYKAVVAQLDSWQAKANLSIQEVAIQPVITDKEIALKQARHPILEAHLKSLKRAIVPLDIELKDDKHLLVISGPNAGGKSVTMKTVGLLQLMFQFGLHLPAEENSKICLFNQLMADIGDDQSIEDDLSTYSSHLAKMKYFLQHADGRSLLLIDEMGSGTDPALGGPIAEAILEHLVEQGSYGVITTHYSNLKEMAQTKTGLVNGAMSFATRQLRPTYELHIGQAGASYAFEVAERSGLPKEIIKNAKDKLGKDKSSSEQSLSQIQHEKQYLKGIRKNNQKQSEHLERLIKNYEELKSRLEKQKGKLVKEYEQKLLKDYNEANRNLEKIIREQKEANSNREALKNVRKDIDKKRQNLASKIQKYDVVPVQENKEPIVVGSEVKLEDSPRIGKVVEIRKDKATVVFGKLRTTVPLKKLIHCVSEKKKVKTVNTTKSNTIVEKSKFDNQLDIRGKYKDEALFELEQFLDKCVLLGVDSARIIHGKGTGALKDLVQQCLRDYPYVKAFKLETDAAGGKGATMVEID